MENITSNIEINKEENSILLNINPEIYNLSVVYTTCYSFLDKAYILIDGDPKFELLVELRPKKEYDLEKLGREFNNELIKYGFYHNQHLKTAGIKTLMLQRILAIDDSIANIYVEKEMAEKLRQQEELLNKSPIQPPAKNSKETASEKNKKPTNLKK